MRCARGANVQRGLVYKTPKKTHKHHNHKHSNKDYVYAAEHDRFEHFKSRRDKVEAICSHAFKIGHRRYAVSRRARRTQKAKRKLHGGPKGGEQKQDRIARGGRKMHKILWSILKCWCP